MAEFPRALTIAGSDSGSGAGIQADLKTFAALGVYGTTAITALTAQNTLGVRAIHEVPAAFVGEQIAAVFEDIGADGVKLGMLSGSATVRVVAEALTRYRAKNIVLDPVMSATDGYRLLASEAVLAMRERLFPLVDVLTPNLPEAEMLLGRRLDTREEMERATRELGSLGPRAVLLKGGHGHDPDRCTDCLLAEGEFFWFEHPRIATLNLHGTGCTFSAAIAALLARALPLAAAVEGARAYVQLAIQRGAERKIGRGRGPLGHLSISLP